MKDPNEKNGEEIEKWARVGRENRMHIKAKSRQRIANDSYRANYEKIQWGTILPLPGVRMERGYDLGAGAVGSKESPVS